ncbi:Rhomboid family protein, putative [Penicillium digitatum]|uniref:Rhomboid family protein, putative n=1 Tax=Penicillium digitatum TaxID=36651 RepID=A0A7T6XRQ3_PENDI|nr:Rhomboid family protein, putative [Penicillium digitatum]
MSPRIKIPPATRICLVSLLTLSLLYNIARWRQIDTTGGTPTTSPLVPYLTLVPSFFYHYPWTIVTATFVEQNIFTVLLNSATIFYGGKYLERAWGSREFSKFIAVVAVIPCVSIIPIYLIWGALGGSSSRALTQICGGVSIQAAFLVAFKQLVPEHTVTIFKGVVKMRVKHFPALFLLLNTISGLIIGTDPAAILSWLGILTSWTYLRFYKRQPDLTGTSSSTGIKGDASETFAFACLFPDAMQPPVAFVADKIYALLVAAKLLKPFSQDDIASGNELVLARGDAGLPTLLNSQRGGVRGAGKREEAERRRAIALKALDRRLQAATVGRVQVHSPGLGEPSSSMPRPTTPTPAAPVGQIVAWLVTMYMN